MIEVAGLGEKQREALAYNLTVQGIHTYHVGQHEVLVHNTCPLPTQIAGRTTKLTTPQAEDLAKYLGYTRTTAKVKGEIVFENGTYYIVQDTTSHNGGVWKIAKSVEDLFFENHAYRDY